MTSWLVIAAGWLIVPVLGVLSRRLAGTWATPFILLAVPYQAIATLSVAMAGPAGYTEPLPAALGALLAALPVFWAGEVCVLAWLRTLPAVERPATWDGEASFERTVRVISWLLVAVTLASFLLEARGISVLGEIVQDEFQGRFSAGPAGFARPLIMLLVVYWIGSTRDWTRARGWVIAGLIFVLLLSFVKGTILLPLVGGFIYRVVARGMRITTPMVATITASVFAVFFIIYGAETIVWGLAGFTPGFSAGILRRISAYLFSGILGFSESWNLGILPAPDDWHVLVAPVWNLFAHFGGFERAPNMGTVYLTVDLLADPAVGTSNVRTALGQILTLAGPVGGVAGIFVLGFVMNALLGVARRTRSAWLLAVSSLMGAALVFGWFDYYFALSFWYILAPCGVLAALLIGVRPLRRFAEAPLT